MFNKYKERVGEIVNAEVYQIWKKEILLIDYEGNELLLPKTEQIPTDFFKKGDTVRAVVSKVDMKNGSPVIILSRTSPVFLERLFETEVPEIFDGLITIKKIVREPGERAKVAVESYDDRIDPVGACVGMKGSRIHGIVRELRNENIDVINWTNNTNLFIQRALAPAKISSMEIDSEKKHVKVFLNPDQVSLAIGKGGLNIKLASRLTGYEIDVFRDIEEEEFDISDNDGDEVVVFEAGEGEDEDQGGEGLEDRVVDLEDKLDQLMAEFEEIMGTEEEEHGDIPTHEQLVKIVQELTFKYIKLEEKMETLQKWVNQKKQKIKVIEWLNQHISPTIGFKEYLSTIQVYPEDALSLFENNIYQTFQIIIENNLKANPDFVYPIKCFSQKTNIFYICETVINENYNETNNNNNAVL